MSNKQTTEVEDPFAATVDLEDHETQPKPVEAPSKPTRRNRDYVPLGVGAFIVGAFLVFGYSLHSTQIEITDMIKASDKETAYYEVARQNVAVNGSHGTEEWRGYYKLGLERYLGQHEFSEFCMPNGFLKDSFTIGSLPCIAVGDLRAVQAYSGEISYFREDSWRRMTHQINVLQQDVHASDYLDIDAFSKAVEDRATKQVREKEDAERQKAAEQARKEIEETTRSIKEALSGIVPLQVPVQRPVIIPENPNPEFSVPKGAE